MKKLIGVVLIFTSIFLLYSQFYKNKDHINTDSKKKKIIKIDNKNLNERQTRILSLLSKNDRLPMRSIENEESSVNVRTLRRDLDKLQSMNLIRKFGSTKSAFYQKL